MNASHYRRWFHGFIGLNLLFFSLQLTFVIFNSSNFISAVPLPRCVYIELLETFFIQCALYFLVSCWQLSLLWSVSPYTFSMKTYDHLYRFIAFSTPLAFLSANALFFPLSLFSRTLLPHWPHLVLQSIMGLSSLPLALLTLNALGMFLKQKPVFLFLIAAGLLWFMQPFSSSPPVTHAPPTKPHLILIGIDSLHPQSIDQAETPTLASFIDQSLWFKETISPLARTYPAWTTILTGLYPAHHHATYNLMPTQQTSTHKSIAWTLQKAGYQTLFATDDRRFNTLDKEFGFQTIIGPKRGVNDVLIGSFNDFPLSNFLINLPIGRLLFPYNHMNRASYFSYYPSTFNHALNNALSSKQANTPLFMAVHFTLPHWPYAFAPSDPELVNDEYRVDHREPLYHAALYAVDQQVASLLVTLKQQGYLSNSLVVLLSDHGETLYTPDSRQTTRATYQGTGTSKLEAFFLKHTATVLNKSAGHGSDLLSPKQYHCVLAFQTYFENRLISPSATLSQRVALMDIAPTLLAFSDLKNEHTMDGISLMGILKDPKVTLPSRSFVMESGMFPNQLLSKEKARQLGQEFFTVDSTHGLLQLHVNKLPILDRLKLYAIIKDDWLLALYPMPEGGYLPIIQQLSTGRWIDDLRTPFARSSEARSLLRQLTQFYNHPWNV